MSRVDNKIALVSGSAQGIGAKTAEVLAAAGATVIVSDVDEMRGNAVSARIAVAGFRSVFRRLDVTQETDWKATMDWICAEFGGLDVLVNNAGIEIMGPVSQLTLEQWHRISSVNLDGVFLGTKCGIWAMTEGSSSRPKGGSIINVASVAGMVGGGFQSAYNMTKGGVRLFTKSIAHECGLLKNGVRVNCVCPAVIRTAMTERALKGWTTAGYGANEDETRENIARLHPLGRFGEPEEVAKAILYLASDDSSFVTGIDLAVDGGYTAV